MVQLLGFAGSALIVTGVMMRPVTWLRAFGLAGASTFIVYGILLGAWPVVLTNVATASLHVYHLRAQSITRRQLAAANEGAGERRSDRLPSGTSGQPRLAAAHGPEATAG